MKPVKIVRALPSSLGTLHGTYDASEDSGVICRVGGRGEQVRIVTSHGPKEVFDQVFDAIHGMLAPDANSANDALNETETPVPVTPKPARKRKVK